MSETVVIAGAGPAGLTAALEILRAKQNVKVIVVEMDAQVGGISKTVNYKGNRIDIGGHRFFSKSDWVMNWWQDILPLFNAIGPQSISYQNKKRVVNFSAEIDVEKEQCMLLRPRLSRIYFLRRFFDYPLKLNINTFKNLGLVRLTKAALSYLFIRLFPVRNEQSLKDFIVNRFGRELYKTFFRDYTEKVWGVSCEQISPEWGAQRIKGVSVSAVVVNALAAPFRKWFGKGVQKNTSLIEQFLYPKRGPGQLWEVVASQVEALGGEVLLQHQVVSLASSQGNITGVVVRNAVTGAEQVLECEHFISSMPVRHLINALGKAVPTSVAEVAQGLVYRDFITVGVLLKKFKRTRYTKADSLNSLPDNWIYIQEPDVQVGRLQIFNNWSPHLVADKNTVWVGMEYFCDKQDIIWQQDEAVTKQLAVTELEKIGLISSEDVLDTFVLKVPKAYPAYFGSYDRFDVIRDFVDSFKNLYLVGRNGMHRYNNQDHSMLTAKLAAESILTGDDKRKEMWDVNVDDDYHEEVEQQRQASV